MEQNYNEIITEVAVIKEGLKSAHRRIDENDRITEGIHKIASNVQSLTLQVKMLTEKLENSVKELKEDNQELKESQKAHGQRIGALESKPAKRWENLVGQIITLIVAAVVGLALGKMM